MVQVYNCAMQKEVGLFPAFSTETDASEHPMIVLTKSVIPRTNRVSLSDSLQGQDSAVVRCHIFPGLFGYGEKDTGTKISVWKLKRYPMETK